MNPHTARLLATPDSTTLGASGAPLATHGSCGWRGRACSTVFRWTIRRLFEHVPVNDASLRALKALNVLSYAMLQPEGVTRSPLSFGSVKAERVVGRGVTDSVVPVVLYFHGGAFVLANLRSHRRLVAGISAAAGIPVVHVEYGMLPDARLDRSVEDCLTAYRALLAEGRLPSEIVFAGDSAGGYLAFEVARRAVDAGLGAPAGVVALSPWLDLQCRYSMEHPNRRTDSYMPLGFLSQVSQRLVDAGADVPDLLSADLSGLPPVLIQVAAGEALRSDAERVAAALHKAGVPCDLQVWRGDFHVFQFADAVGNSPDAIQHIGRFTAAAIEAAQAKMESRYS